MAMEGISSIEGYPFYRKWQGAGGRKVGRNSIALGEVTCCNLLSEFQR
jgi:hypothetical protein